MKKRLIIAIGVVLTAVILLGYCVYDLSIQNGQDTVIRITQKDVNGTPISVSSPIVLINKAGHRSPFHDAVAGYALLSKNPLGKRIPRKNMTISLRYKAVIDQKSAIKTISNAKYVNVASQQVETPVLNNQQFEGRKKRKAVLRVNTSDDGVIWSKLSLNYPNADMQHPVAFYQNKKLSVLSGKSMYTTINYSKWRKTDLHLTSSKFDDAQVFSTFSKDNTDYLIVKAKDQLTHETRFYFGEMNFKTGTPANWKLITIVTGSKQNIKNIQRIGNMYYAIVANRSKFELYRTTDLTHEFKSVKMIKVSSQDQISSASLVGLPNNQLRLVYNELDKDKYQTGTFYQDLSDTFQPVGEQGNLTTDFFWYDFQTVRSEF